MGYTGRSVGSRSSSRLNGSRAPDAVAFGMILDVLRRHVWLILAVTALSVGAAAFLALRDPRVYRATATVRLGQARQALNEDIQDATPLPQRTVDPVLSLTERLRSRQVVAHVVDSLGTRLSSLSADFAVSRLRGIHVDPAAPPDTIALQFNSHDVVASVDSQHVRASYGQQLQLAGVGFTVPARPDSAGSDALLVVASREPAIDQVLTGLEIVPRQGTDVVDVSYSASDAALAQSVVNAVVQSFEAFNVRSAQEQSRLRGVFLTDQLRQTDSSLAQAQASLAVFRSRQQLANSTDRLAAAQAALLALDSQREQLVADRRTYGDLPTLLASPDDSVRGAAVRSLAYAPDMASNPTIAKLSQQVIEYRVKLDSLTTGPSRSAATNPDLMQFRGTLVSTEQELLNAVKTQVRSLDSRIDALAALRQRSGASMEVLPALAAEEVRLQARVDALRAIGDHLRQEGLRARLAEAAEVGDMQIMDLASLPYLATWPMGLLKLALGLLAGLFLGCGVAYLLEATNTAIRRPEDLEDALQVSGLAVIPRVRGAGKTWRRPLPRLRPSNGRRHGRPAQPSAQGLVTVAQPHSIGTEAFRMLRTSIILSDWGKRLKTIVVTSVAPGEGKTLTAANLGVVFAREGLRVVVVDGDARRARLHKIFFVPRSPGLNELVGSEGAVGLAAPTHPIALDCIQSTAVDRLFVLPAGAPSRTSDSFHEASVRRLLGELSASFDLVIIDAPPVLATADATILASMADGVLFVAGPAGPAAAQSTCLPAAPQRRRPRHWFGAQRPTRRAEVPGGLLLPLPLSRGQGLTRLPSNRSLPREPL